MDIEPVIRNLMELTLAAGQALADDDLARCSALLSERGAVMRQLDAASTDDRSAPGHACEELLQRLQRLDAELQRELRKQMDDIGSKLAAVNRPPTREEPAPPLCLDRRA